MKKILNLSLILLMTLVPIYPSAEEPTERVFILFQNDVDERLFEKESFEIHHVFDRLSAVSATIPISAIRELKQNPSVAYIESDPMVAVGNEERNQDDEQNSNLEKDLGGEQETNLDEEQPDSDPGQDQNQEQEENNLDDETSNEDENNLVDEPSNEQEQEQDSNVDETIDPDEELENDPDNNQGNQQEPELDTEIENEQYPAQIVDWGYTHVLNDKAKEHGWTGKGVKIGIIDTGVRTNHPDIELAGGISFIGESTSYEDDEGHGTHVAGIIGAIDNEIGIVGIAPEAELYAIKALNNIGIGNLSDVIAGIQWAIDNDIDVINLSLTSHQNHFLLERAVNQAYEEGILTIAASGNATSELPSDTDVLFPARYNSVIAVGAVDQQNQQSTFSFFGPALEFVAPGENIYSTFSSMDYSYMNGTSMAAPYVSGIAALYKQAYPDYTGEKIRELMRYSALDLGEVGQDNIFGYGLIQAPTSARNFIDVPTDAWYAEEIDFLYEQDIITGYQDHTFLPNEPVTRAEAITMIGRTLGEVEEKLQTSYLDVPQASFASGYIAKASEKDIINGYPDGNFQPNAPIIRGDVAAMLQRAYQFTATAEDSFLDVEKTKYYYEPIQALYSNKISVGYPDQTYRPLTEVTRAEFSVLLSRILDETFQS